MFTEMTGTKLPIYTDPTLSLHRVLGMTLKSMDPGTVSERGHYVKTTAFEGIRRSLKDAMASRLPVFEKAGDVAQLGGEFILGPG